jgi:hypothetical protein
LPAKISTNADVIALIIPVDPLPDQEHNIADLSRKEQMRFWISGPRLLGGIRPGVSFGPEDFRAPRAPRVAQARTAAPPAPAPSDVPALPAPPADTGWAVAKSPLAQDNASTIIGGAEINLGKITAVAILFALVFIAKQIF